MTVTCKEVLEEFGPLQGPGIPRRINPGRLIKNAERVPLPECSITAIHKAVIILSKAAERWPWLIDMQSCSCFSFGRVVCFYILSSAWLYSICFPGQRYLTFGINTGEHFQQNQNSGSPLVLTHVQYAWKKLSNTSGKHVVQVTDCKGLV